MDKEIIGSESELTDVLRVEGVNSKGYGIVPKLVMQDQRLSAEAKCIYAYFCSYAGVGNQAFPSVKLILSHLGMSKTRYYNHINLLKQFGYIRTQQVKQKGKFNKTIYTLCTNPIPIISVDSQKQDISPCPNFKDTEEKPCPSFVDTQIVDTGNKDTNINSIIKLTNNNNNNLSIYPSDNKNKKDDGLMDKIPEENKNLPEVKSESTGTETAPDNKQVSKAEIQYTLNTIQAQLDIKSLDPAEKMYSELTELVYDVVNDKSDYIRVNGAETSGDMVRQRLLKLQSVHLQYVVDNFKQQKKKIKNIRSYLITALYNSYTSVSSYYTNDKLKDQSSEGSEVKNNIPGQRNKAAPANMVNFTQRKYDEEYFESLYSNA